MYISQIKLTNWKNFQEVSCDMSERVFIVGANASGKSNLLDAIRFMRDIAIKPGGLQYAVEKRGGFTKIRCLSARTKTNVKLEFELSESGTNERMWRYSLDLKHTGGGIFKNEATILQERVIRCSDSKELLNRKPHKNENDPESLKYTYLEQNQSNKEFRDIAHFFSEIQYLNLIPQLVREHESAYMGKDKEDFFGRNFLERISIQNEKIKKSYLGKISDVLKIAVPQLEKLDFKKDNMGRPHLEARYQHWRAKGSIQKEDQFSDGTLRLIGLLWALLDGREPVLLEEPEINLHSEIIKQLPEFIAKLQKKKNWNRQVILTTHSYDLLDNQSIGAKEILFLKNDIEGTQIFVADKIDDVRNMLIAGFSAAEAVLPRTKPKDIAKLNQLRIFE
jgi:predicted ATPase